MTSQCIILVALLWFTKHAKILIFPLEILRYTVVQMLLLLPSIVWAGVNRLVAFIDTNYFFQFFDLRSNGIRWPLVMHAHMNKETNNGDIWDTVTVYRQSITTHYLRQCMLLILVIKHTKPHLQLRSWVVLNLFLTGNVLYWFISMSSLQQVWSSWYLGYADLRPITYSHSCWWVVLHLWFSWSLRYADLCWPIDSSIPRAADSNRDARVWFSLGVVATATEGVWALGSAWEAAAAVTAWCMVYMYNIADRASTG